LTSPPDKANNHLLGERRQRISTNYATPPSELETSAFLTPAARKIFAACSGGT
jgi:hypothetical protein